MIRNLSGGGLVIGLLALSFIAEPAQATVIKAVVFEADISPPADTVRLADDPSSKRKKTVSSKAPSKRAKPSGGRLSRKDVLGGIRSHMGAIQKCYEDLLVANPKLSGKVTIDWTVNRKGAVENPRVVSSTVEGTALGECIVGVFRNMEFNEPTGGPAKIRYPFVFKS